MRKFLSALLLSCASLPIALAQDYPTRPIRMTVGFAPSGGADIAARLVAQKLSEALGQNVVVENRMGAGGSLAAERVATASSDGHTLLMIAAGSATILPATRALPYDMQRDFAPVSLVAIGAYVLAVPQQSQMRSVQDLITAARSDRGKVTYGTSGAGGTGHIAGLLFSSMAGVEMLHIPYKGGSQAVVAAAGGQVMMSLTAITSAHSLLDAGKLRALAVTTLQRSMLLPSIPTLDEAGLRGFDRATWWGLLAPAQVPKHIVSRLNGIIVKGFNTADMKEALRRIGAESKTSSPEEFAALIKRDLIDNARLVKAAGLAPQGK